MKRVSCARSQIKPHSSAEKQKRATLRRYLEQALDRKAKVVMIGGAPGVGKTRIAREIGAEASERGFWVLAGSCYDRDDSVPFMPVVEILETALAQATSPQAFREGLGNDAAEIARLMPQLRRIYTDIPPPLELAPGQSRRILFSAIAEFLGRTAGNRPVLLLLEDLHWADEGTLSLLNYLARSVSTVPVMIVGTYRDNELDPADLLAKTLDDLIRLHLVEQIGLRGLPQDAVAGMIRSLSGRAPPEAVVSLFYSNTEGNPFFIEELYQHLVERAGLLDSNGEFRRDLKRMEVQVPPSLRLVIGRRLARLSDETQKILGSAAVIGRSFTFELLEASTVADGDSVLGWVEEAESAGLISATLQYPQTRFQFSHELIRKAVLEDLSAPRRQRLHLQIADAIKRLHADALEDHANDLAHHLWEAGDAANPDETVRYLAMAAKRAFAQLAYGEAARLYQMALDILKEMPPGRSRDSRELELQTAMGSVAFVSEGEGSADAGKALARAVELAVALDDIPRRVRPLLLLGYHHVARGELRRASEISRDLYKLCQEARNPELEAAANHLMGHVAYWMGEFRKAEQHMGAAAAEDPGRTRVGLRGHALVSKGVALWHLGFPDQALALAREALMLGEDADNPYTYTTVLFWAGITHLLRGELALAENLFRKSFNLCAQRGFPAIGASNTVYMGLLSALRGQAQAGLEQLSRGLEILAASSATIR